VPPPSPEPSDEELARRIRDGDESAAQALFDRHLTDLRARARHLLPALLRRKVAESDVIQEAYLAAFLRLGDFRDEGEGSFGLWLGKILEHKVKHEISRYLGTDKRAAVREVHRAHSSTSAGIGDPPDPGPTASAAAVHRESQEELREAMAGLSEDHRSVMRMVNLEGLPIRAVAELMDRSEAAVYKLYARALAEFGKRLEFVRGRSVRPRRPVGGAEDSPGAPPKPLAKG